MKEFLKTNTVTYNLMSFTGFKSVLIFSLLSDGPKSYREIQKILLEHEYLHEKISIDAIRIYMNSLAEIGCNVQRITQNGVTKYSIPSHPFELKISDKQVKSIIKIYKAISKSIEVTDLISLQHFFEKISKYVTNETLKEKLKNISPLHNIDPELIQKLLTYAQNNTEITMLYDSPNSGKGSIILLVDKLAIQNSKLYVYGVNSKYKEYSSFLVSRIKKIESINLHSKTLEMPDIIVGYEYTKDHKENLDLLPNEKIIKKKRGKYLIEITSKSKFDIIQRLLYHNYKCKVLYPENIKSELIYSLKKTKEGYIED